MRSAPNNKLKWFWIGGFAGYLVMLYLLVLAEMQNPDASIQNFWDALWYSLVTMSTVGYGDLYPVTDLGRILGAVFVLLSVGLLTFLIGVMLRLATGKLLPAIRLYGLRKRPWYLFSHRSSCAAALIQDLMTQHPEGVFLLPEEGEGVLPEGCLTYSGPMETLATKKKEGCSLFYMQEEGYTTAVNMLKLGHPVYCQTEYAPDACPEGLTLFNRYDCTAQAYWQEQGLSRKEQKILLIGDGKFAQYLLNRGLMCNILSKEQKLRYHVFGDWENYRRNHHRLNSTISINVEGQGDSLYFHADNWNEDSALLVSADRIIFCWDDKRENLAQLQQLRKYFPTEAKVHVLFDRQIPGVTVFGTEESIFTQEYVMRDRQSYGAKCMHGLYSDSVPDAPRWGQLSEFTRQSNIAAADHLLVKLRILLEDDGIRQVSAKTCAAAYERYLQQKQTRAEELRWIEHQRWMRFHSLYNWQYGPKRDNAARIHPLMLPFEALDLKEQEKDDYAWELIGQLAGKLEEKKNVIC